MKWMPRRGHLCHYLWHWFSTWLKVCHRVDDCRMNVGWLGWLWMTVGWLWMARVWVSLRVNIPLMPHHNWLWPTQYSPNLSVLPLCPFDLDNFTKYIRIQNGGAVTADKQMMSLLFHYRRLTSLQMAMILHFCEINQRPELPETDIWRTVWLLNSVAK